MLDLGLQAETSEQNIPPWKRQYSGLGLSELQELRQQWVERATSRRLAGALCSIGICHGDRVKSVQPWDLRALTS